MPFSLTDFNQSVYSDFLSLPFRLKHLNVKVTFCAVLRLDFVAVSKSNETFFFVLEITCLTLARKRCFATFAGVAGWCDPPWRFQTKRRRASRKRPADCARRVLAIGGIIQG